MRGCDPRDAGRPYRERVSTPPDEDASDDDALTWHGDDLDATATPRAASDPVALPRGFDAVGKGSDDVGRIEDDGTVVMPTEPQPMGNAALVTFGILGGAYLLFTIGWIIGGLRLQGIAQFLVSPAVYQIALWLAVAAAPLWFGAVWLLTRTSKTWVRVVWLAGGALLFVPWPFVMVGAVGQ